MAVCLIDLGGVAPRRAECGVPPHFLLRGTHERPPRCSTISASTTLVTIRPPFLLHLHRTGESGRLRELLDWSGSGGAVHCQGRPCFVATSAQSDVIPIDPMTTIQSEFERLRRVFEKLGTPFKPAPPATNEQISAVLTETGVDVSSDLVELWQISNGSNGVMWFVEGEDEFTPYSFLSTSKVIATWKMFQPYDENFYKQWVDDEDDGSIRGPKIQPRIVRHKKWLSFAEFNGGSHSLLFDADPTPAGCVGQIINFIHDPDGVTWTFKSFSEFFTRSNDILYEWLDSPRELREQLWIFG